MIIFLEDQESQYRDVLNELRQKKNSPDFSPPEQLEIDIGLPNVNEPIPPVNSFFHNCVCIDKCYTCITYYKVTSTNYTLLLNATPTVLI